MTIKGQPDLGTQSIESAGGRGDPDSNLMYKDVFGRPPIQALYGFPACVLQVYFRGVCAGEMLSRLRCAQENDVPLKRNKCAFLSLSKKPLFRPYVRA
jgi:hypothetical protein